MVCRLLTSVASNRNGACGSSSWVWGYYSLSYTFWQNSTSQSRKLRFKRDQIHRTNSRFYKPINAAVRGFIEFTDGLFVYLFNINRDKLQLIILKALFTENLKPCVTDVQNRNNDSRTFQFRALFPR
jgi:hypothetical protein